jgi:flagellar hook-basal body complex protein FliE
MIAAIPLISTAVSSLLGGTQASSAVTQAMPATSASGGDFSAMMARVANETVNKLNTSESMSIAGITGKATTQSVVEAVMSAQESLQTAVAVRDKAVSAFQEVSRMAI